MANVASDPSGLSCWCRHCTPGGRYCYAALRLIHAGSKPPLTVVARALEHVVNHLEDTRGALADRLAQAMEATRRSQVRADGPFEHGARPTELERRQQEPFKRSTPSRRGAVGVSSSDDATHPPLTSPCRFAADRETLPDARGTPTGMGQDGCRLKAKAAVKQPGVSWRSDATTRPPDARAQRHTTVARSCSADRVGLPHPKDDLTSVRGFMGTRLHPPRTG